MEMAVIAGPYLVLLQQVDDLLTVVASIKRRIVEKAQLFPLPRRFKGCLQPDQLPVENFGGVLPPVLLVEPAPGTAQGHIPAELAVVMENAQGLEPLGGKKPFILAAVFHQ